MTPLSRHRPPSCRVSRRASRPPGVPGVAQTRGQGTVEYLIVLALVGISLSAGSNVSSAPSSITMRGSPTPCPGRERAGCRDRRGPG
jgi:hypothetical protein